MNNYIKLFSLVLLLIITFRIEVLPEPPQVFSIASSQITTKIIDDTKRHIECLAKNIYFEARSESYEGQLAVAQITLNRMNDPKYPKDVCDVVYQKKTKENRVVCQFSWTCFHQPDIKDIEAWHLSIEIAKHALTHKVVHDILAKSNALYYHATYVKPKWQVKKVTKIGKHIFYAAL
jgi:spore germination cell wall hydrolase CwlJ-like protein